jgi:hypothetical protein
VCKMNRCGASGDEQCDGNYRDGFHLEILIAVDVNE